MKPLLNEVELTTCIYHSFGLAILYVNIEVLK